MTDDAKAAAAKKTRHWFVASGVAFVLGAVLQAPMLGVAGVVVFFYAAMKYNKEKKRFLKS